MPDANTIATRTPQGYQMPQAWPSVVHMLAHAVAASPQQEAVVLGAQRLHYRALGACVAHFAAELRTLGVGEGSRVALLMHNSIDMVVALFSVLATGAQLVPLNPAYTPSELLPMLENADCHCVVHDAHLASSLSTVLSGFDAERRIAVGDGHRALSQPATKGNTAGIPLPAGDALAMLLYTGGTTGRSKGVNLSHRAVAINTSQRDALLPTREGLERILVVTPLFHSYALATCFTTVFARGTLVLMDRYKPANVLRLLDEEHITILAGSPTIFLGLLACEELDQASLRALRCSYSGSAALPQETLRNWEHRSGSVVVEGYGQTEAGPVLTYNPLEGPRKSGSVGIATPMTEIQIVDLQTGEQVLGPGETGEIRARGPQIMQGYRGLAEETRAALRGGWLYTGDIGEVDEDGYFYIRDRKKDMVIVSGFNVYPREVEEALFRHPGVHENVVVGVPDAYRGEALVALVVPSADGLTEQDLREHLAQRLVKYKIPARIHFVRALPRTAIGKPDKASIRRALQQSASSFPPL